MRIYIAGPWRDRVNMPALGVQFEKAGHVITHKWWLAENVPEGERTMEVLREQAKHDLYGVKIADLLVLLNTCVSEGKAVEQGIALSRGMPIIAVGVRGEHSKNVFHYLPNYTWVATVEDAVKELEAYAS